MNINASPTVTITPNYKISGSVPNLTVPFAALPRHADGGIVTSKQLSWISEEGPESIIPLTAGRRSKALELYEKTGELLGVGTHAEGGIVGADAVPVAVHNGGTSRGSGESNVTVEVSANPTINITAGSGTNAEEIKRLVEQAIRNMMGDISNEMTKKLARQFANMGIA